MCFVFVFVKKAGVGILCFLLTIVCKLHVHVYVLLWQIKEELVPNPTSYLKYIALITCGSGWMHK